MATLTLTVPDAVVPRVRDAYGVTTNAELKAKIVAAIKNRVINYEVNIAQEAEQAKQDALRQTSNSAVTTAELKASAEIALS